MQERVAAALRLEDVVAVPLEDRAREDAHRLLVLDEEDRLGAAPVASSRWAASSIVVAQAASARGRYTLNVVPSPGSL